jgi:hypothetical protein
MLLPDKEELGRVLLSEARFKYVLGRRRSGKTYILVRQILEYLKERKCNILVLSPTYPLVKNIFNMTKNELGADVRIFSESGIISTIHDSTLQFMDIKALSDMVLVGGFSHVVFDEYQGADELPLPFFRYAMNLNKALSGCSEFIGSRNINSLSDVKFKHSIFHFSEQNGLTKNCSSETFILNGGVSENRTNYSLDFRNEYLGEMYTEGELKKCQ